jgi:hypothetical protein
VARDSILGEKGVQEDEVFKTGEERIGRATYVAEATNGHVDGTFKVGAAVYSILVKDAG